MNGNGVVTNYSYDPKTRRLNTLNNLSQPTNTLLQDNTYKYDNVGNIINIQDNGLNPRGQNYKYDEINRLISSDGSWTDNNNNTLNYKNGFEYSPSGKMMRKNMDSRRIDNKQGIYNVIYENAYSYNNQNNPYGASSIKDIMTGSIDNYEWDKKGNMIYQNNESTGRERALCWTEDNRLQGYRETRGQSGYYNYRAGGERNIKYVGETVTITQNGKTYYRPVLNQPTLYASELITINERGYTKHYYEEGKRICSKIGGGFGGVEAREVLDNRVKLLNGSYLELPGEKREGIRRSFECMEEEVELENEGALRSIMEIEMGRNDAEPAFYYQSDHLGSASYVTDNSGAVTQTLNYLPYGEDWVDLQNFNVMPVSYNLGVYQFNGKEKDQESGYNYYGARYYDSEKISWISVDPMSDKYPSLSPYVYCANNPVILVDPNGEEIVDAQGRSMYEEGKWTKYATKDAKRIGNAMMQTTAGTKQFNILVDSKAKIKLKISNAIKKKDKGSLVFGEMQPGKNYGTKEKPILKDATIELYYGSIKEGVDRFNKKNKNGINFEYDEFLGAVAGHEAEHITVDNLKLNLNSDKKVENRPNEIRQQILQEIVNIKYKIQKYTKR